MLVVVAGGGLWYVFRPKPELPRKPWNRTAIRAEFREPATSESSASINLWFMLTNTTDADYRIDSLSEITSAGLMDNDALYGFNQGISFEVPLIIPAHRSAAVILHIPFPTEHLSVPDGASDSAVMAYKKNVMAFLRSKYSHLKGFAILDEGIRYEIDFPVP